MCFWLRKVVKNEDTFFLRQMRMLLSKLEFLVIKSKLNAYKKLKRAKKNFMCN